jgi:hypothetical protein
MNVRINELLQQMLETELGGVKVYETALTCARDQDLRDEWTKYLQQTHRHVEIVQALMQELGAGEVEMPSRFVVRDIGKSLVAAMNQAKTLGDPAGAEIVACECVVFAETKDHLNWQLLSRCAETAEGPAAQALSRACGEVEDEEDEHIYHSKGWCRELWLQALGLDAVLPPPEEERDVKSAAAAAKVEQSRKKAVVGRH